MLPTSLAVALVALAAPAAPAEKESDRARALVAEFLTPGADHAALTRALRPSPEDFRAVFEGDAAARAERSYAAAWDGGKMLVAPRPGQTELKLAGATTEDLRQGSGGAREFPGGWAKAAPFLKKGLTFYRFKFVEPGKDLGMSFDGLAFVNGRWVIFPKPWRALEK